MFKFSFQEASVTDKESLAAAKQEIDFLRLLEMVVFDNLSRCSISNCILKF